MMRSLLILFSTAGLILGGGSGTLKFYRSADPGPLWAATSFDEVAQTPHNLLATRVQVGLKEICLTCHTDGRGLEDETGKESLSAAQESLLGPSGGIPGEVPKQSPGSTPRPLWSAHQEGQVFSLISSIWTLQETTERKPFGSSSACLGCHDGALAADVHGEKGAVDQSVATGMRLMDHPTSIPYPRRPDGIFSTERPTPGSLRYWSIADRTVQGVVMPSGPVSAYFRIPEGADTQEPLMTSLVVRTSYGMIHCDSCHNPHLNRHRPFLRTSPQDLCFVCHDR